MTWKSASRQAVEVPTYRPLMLLSCSCLVLGWMTGWLRALPESVQATCRAARGPSQGMLDRIRAADTALMAMLLGSTAPSVQRTVAVICNKSEQL